MSKTQQKTKPSNAPTFFKGGWFYEYRGRLEVLIETPHGTFHGNIPWRKIIAAAKRCRPEEVRDAR
jgi:hypothetical protein